MSDSASGIDSASRPDGLTAPVRTSASAPPTAWPSAQPSTIASTLSCHGSSETTPPLERTTTVRVGGAGDRLDQRDVRGGQVEVLAVEPFGLVLLVQSDEDDGDVGRCRRRAGLAAQRFGVAGRVFE